MQGSTVSTIGNFKQLKIVRRVVEDTMYNIHPIYNIKELMIKRELMKDETLKQENWDRFLPNFKKKNVNRKKKDTAQTGEQPASNKPKKIKKEYSPFPPPQLPRKEDIQMETGEYFLSKEQQKKQQLKEKTNKQQKKAKEKQEQKLKQYEQPDVQQEITKEDSKAEKKKHAAQEESIEDLKNKFISSKKLKKVSIF